VIGELALDVTEPLIVGAYGRAAFDAVGPRLLIGWAEVDARHRQTHRRPISAETLRKHLHNGAARSRSLVAALRAGSVPEVENGIRVVPR
jgi:hypothetical protein